MLDLEISTASLLLQQHEDYSNQIKKAADQGKHELLNILHQMHQELAETRGFPDDSLQVDRFLESIDYELWSGPLDVLAHGKDCKDIYRRAMEYITKQRVFSKQRVAIVYTVIEKNYRTIILLAHFSIGCSEFAKGAGGNVLIPSRGWRTELG
jgi:hypothetical protein